MSMLHLLRSQIRYLGGDAQMSMLHLLQGLHPYLIWRIIHFVLLYLSHWLLTFPFPNFLSPLSQKKAESIAILCFFHFCVVFSWATWAASAFWCTHYVMGRWWLSFFKSCFISDSSLWILKNLTIIILNSCIMNTPMK